LATLVVQLQPAARCQSFPNQSSISQFDIDKKQNTRKPKQPDKKATKYAYTKTNKTEAWSRYIYYTIHPAMK